MVSSYPLPEGFSEFDVFSLGSCLLVEGECFRSLCWNSAKRCEAAEAAPAAQRCPLTGPDASAPPLTASVTLMRGLSLSTKKKKKKALTV